MWSETVQALVANPRHPGPLEGATHQGVAGVPGDGPYMILWFEVVDDQITRVAFQTFGCPAAIACGSMAAMILTGRTLAQASHLTAKALVLALHGLPEGKEHCPALAIEALHQAFPELLLQGEST